MRRMRHLPVREQALNLNRLLQGHYAYFGVAGNFRALQRIGHAVERYWRKMLSSRSRKGHISWDVFHQITRHPLQRPRLRLPQGAASTRCAVNRLRRAECGKSARCSVGAGGG